MSSEQVNDKDEKSVNLDLEKKDRENRYTVLEDATEKEKSENKGDDNIKQISEEEQPKYNLSDYTGGEHPPGDNAKQEEIDIQIDERRKENDENQIEGDQDFSHSGTSYGFFQMRDYQEPDESEESVKDARDSDSSIKPVDNLNEIEKQSESETSSKKIEQKNESESLLSIEGSETRRSSSIINTDEIYLEENEFLFDDRNTLSSNKTSESSKSVKLTEIDTNLHYLSERNSILFKLIRAEDELSDKDVGKTLLKVDLQELISGYKSEDRLIKDSLEVVSALVKIRQDLICIENEPIILRNDYKSYKGVRILSGGHMGHEPLFTAYIGKGMLTGAVLGTVNDPPSLASVIKAMQELAIYSPGLLIIILNSVENRLIFSLAIEYLKMEGYSDIKLVVVMDDCYESLKSPVGRRGLAGIILLYKLAGSMADCGKTLDEIFISVCKASKTITTISCMTNPSKIIGCGMAKDAKDGIHFNRDQKQMIREMIDYCLSPKKHFSMRLMPNDCLIVLINNYRSVSLEFYIIIDQVLKEIQSRNIKILRVYANNFITGYWSGFSITLMIDINERLMKYLDSPTSVPVWPKNPSYGVLHTYKLPYKKEKFHEMGPILFHQDIKVVKTALVTACKSLILCETELNKMHYFENHGTKLKCGAEAVLKASKQSVINHERPFNLLIDISEILVETLQGSMGAMYGCLFEGAARSFLRNELTTVTCQSWIEAMDSALKTLKAYTNAKEGIVSLITLLIPKLMSIEESFAGLPYISRVFPAFNILETLRLKISNRTKQLENNNLLQNQLNVELYAIIIMLHAIYSSLYWTYCLKNRNSIEDEEQKSKISISETSSINRKSQIEQSTSYSQSIDGKTSLSGRRKLSSEGINENDFITEEFEDIEEFVSFENQLQFESTVDSKEESFYTDVSEVTEELSFIPT